MEGGSEIILPANLSAPATYYTVYEMKDVALTVDVNSGDYFDRGLPTRRTCIREAPEVSPSSFGIVPLLSNLVFIDVTDQYEMFNMESYALIENTTLTWHSLISDLYPPMPRML